MFFELFLRASMGGRSPNGMRDVCLLNDEGHRAIEGSSRPLLVNVTAAFDASRIDAIVSEHIYGRVPCALAVVLVKLNSSSATGMAPS